MADEGKDMVIALSASATVLLENVIAIILGQSCLTSSAARTS